MIDRIATVGARSLCAASPIFTALAAETATRLAARADTIDLGAGTVLFDQGERPDFLFVLVSGRGILSGRNGKKAETVVEFIQPSESLLISAVVLDAPYPVGARMTEASHLISIPASLFRACLAIDATFAATVAAALSSQLHRVVGHNLDLKLRTAPQRLAAYLLELCGGKSGWVTLHHERRLLAGRLGMTPESLSRAFAQIGPVGVHGRGHAIHISDAKRLRQFSTDNGPAATSRSASGIAPG